MTLIFEFGPPFQAKPGIFRSRIMTRVWWLWFAVGKLNIPLHEFADQRRYEWRMS